MHTYEQLLLNELESVGVISFNGECSTRELDRLLGPTFVVIGEERLNCDDYGVEVVTVMRQVRKTIVRQLQTTHTCRELLLEPCAELVSVWGSEFLQVGVVAKRGRAW
jgi:hypothetical protein